MRQTVVDAEVAGYASRLVIHVILHCSVARLDCLTGCSDCMLLMTGVITLYTAVDSGYKSGYWCIQSLQCRKLY